MDERPTRRALRVLIAEDETLIRLDIRQILEETGCEVCGVATNGAEAVALAAQTRPDVALLDIKMPVLDGIEATRQILAAGPLPIVLLTAYATPEIVDQAVSAGASGYLVKPFDAAALLPALRVAWARHSERSGTVALVDDELGGVYLSGYGFGQ